MIGYDYQDWKYGYGKPKGQVYDETETSRRFKTGLTMTTLFGDRAPQAPDVVMCVELGLRSGRVQGVQVTRLFYDEWLSAYGEPKNEPYDETEARRRFEARTTVTALFGEKVPEAPEVVVRVELGGDIVVVNWLDHLQRPALEYLWNREDRMSETPGNRLHLQRVHMKTYDHEVRLIEGKSTYNETLYLNTDGSYTAYRGRRDEPAERGDGNAPEEVKWMPLPVFGEWEPFLDPDL